MLTPETAPSVFQRILEREIPGVIIASSNLVFSILTNKATSPGHSLIIPKRFVRDFTELEPQEHQEWGEMKGLLSHGLKEYAGRERVGFHVSGFEVEHLHEHAIPANNGKEISIQNTREISMEERLRTGSDIQDILKKYTPNSSIKFPQNSI